MKSKIIKTALTAICIFLVIAFIVGKLRSCGNTLPGSVFDFPHIDLGFLDGHSFLDHNIKPDTLIAIEDYNGPVDTLITAGGLIEEGHFAMTEVDPVTQNINVVHYDLPHHGPAKIEPNEDGGFTVSQRAVGLELGGTLGVSTKGWAGTLEVVYFNDLFGVDDLNPHIALSAVSSYDKWDDIQAGIGLDFDVLPDYTNMRANIHYTTDFSGEHGVTLMLTTELFSVD